MSRNLKQRLAAIEDAAKKRRKRSIYGRGHDLAGLNKYQLAEYWEWRLKYASFFATHKGADLWAAIIADDSDFPELNPSIARLI